MQRRIWSFLQRQCESDKIEEEMLMNSDDNLRSKFSVDVQIQKINLCDLDAISQATKERTEVRCSAPGHTRTMFFPLLINNTIIILSGDCNDPPNFKTSGFDSISSS